MSENKQYMHLEILGNTYEETHTILRHLMFGLGGISERDIKSSKKRASKTDNDAYLFSNFMNQEQEDWKNRLYGTGCYCAEFFTDTKRYSMSNYSSHMRYVRNFITMANCEFTDVVLILIPANYDFTESIFWDNSIAYEKQKSVRLYPFLCRILGIKQIIIGIDKMDCDEALYKESKYNEIKEKIISMLLKTGWSKEFIEESIPILPISGLIGDNLFEKSDKMPWWNGMNIVNPNKEKITIVTLKDALDKMIIDTNSVINNNVSISTNSRVAISGVYTIKSKDKKSYNNVVTGVVVQNKIMVGDEIIFVPTHTTDNPCSGKISSIDQYHKSIDCAITGSNYGFYIDGLKKENMPKNGNVMVLKNDILTKSAYSFTCRIIVLEYSGTLNAGVNLPICVRTGRSIAKLTAINWKNSKGVKQYDQNDLNENDVAECVFEPMRPLVVDSFDNCKELSLIAIIEKEQLIMVGKIISVNFEKETEVKL